jgi:hypothetical protein
MRHQPDAPRRRAQRTQPLAHPQPSRNKDFWDETTGDEFAELAMLQLTHASHAFSEADLYIGDDKKLHFSNERIVISALAIEKPIPYQQQCGKMRELNHRRKWGKSKSL